jgi:hypothetical protein
MPLLSTILTEKRQEMLKLMSQFNFKTDDIMLVCQISPRSLLPIADDDELEHELYFVTDSIKPDENTETDESNYFDILSDMTSLEESLSKSLDCDVGILLLRNIQGLYWGNLLNHCAKISEQTTIMELFNVDDLNKVSIKSLSNKSPEKSGINLPEAKTADKSSQNSLFKRKRSDSDETRYSNESSSESEKEELIDEKVKELENLPDQILTEIWNRIQRSKTSKKELSDDNAPSASIAKSTRVK